MKENEEEQYRILLRRRFKALLGMLGLEELGFAEFTGQTVANVYALINGNRNLSMELAKSIGRLLEFDGEKIFNLAYKIPERIKYSPELIKFKAKYKLNDEYFLDTLVNRKRSKYVESRLTTDVQLEQPTFLSHIRMEINKDDSISPFDSNELSKILNYLVNQDKLLKTRDYKRKKDGQLSKNKYDLFYKKNVG